MHDPEDVKLGDLLRRLLGRPARPEQPGDEPPRPVPYRDFLKRR